MDQYEWVRTAHRVYKKSIRQIARETGHTRQTVRKVFVGQEPKYRREKGPACPVMDPVSGIVRAPGPEMRAEKYSAGDGQRRVVAGPTVSPARRRRAARASTTACRSDSLLRRLGPVRLEVSGERYALLHPGRDEYRMSASGSITLCLFRLH